MTFCPCVKRRAQMCCVKRNGKCCFKYWLHKTNQVRNDSIYSILCSKLHRSEYGFRRQKNVAAATWRYSHVSKYLFNANDQRLIIPLSCLSWGAKTDDDDDTMTRSFYFFIFALSKIVSRCTHKQSWPYDLTPCQ